MDSLVTRRRSLEEYTRDSFGIYAELGVDLTEDFFVQAAVRYEDYSDFGAETVYKIAAKYDLSDSFGVRGSFNTGFRAPTPGQQGTTNVSTRLPAGVPVASGLFPASSAGSICARGKSFASRNFR